MPNELEYDVCIACWELGENLLMKSLRRADVCHRPNQISFEYL
jgi:hypothetical protein